MAAKGEYIPKKRGPKSKYRPKMCEEIKKAAAKGCHVSGMCVAIGIASEDTFFRWVRENEEFAAAYKEAQLISKAFYEEQLLRGSLGLIKGFNATSMAMIMNNKFPEDYKRGAGGSNTEINIGSINQVAVDPAELDRKLEEAKAKLRALNHDPDAED